MWHSVTLSSIESISHHTAPCSQDPPAIEIVSRSRMSFLPANAEINGSKARWEIKTENHVLQGEHFLKVHYLLCKVIQAQADRPILGGFETVMLCWFWQQCEVCAYSLPGPLAGQVASRSALNTGDGWEKGCARESLQRLMVRMEFCKDSRRWKMKKYTALTITNKHHQTSSSKDNRMYVTADCTCATPGQVPLPCLYQLITLDVHNLMHTSAIRCPHWPQLCPCAHFLPPSYQNHSD